MRLLHTSDWHLGRSLHGLDLHQAQQGALEHLVAVVDSHDVDAVLVAGDIYDRAIPPVESVQLLSWVLDELIRRVPVVLISGNHDSAARLGFGAGLYRDRLHVRTAAASVGEPVTLADEHGPVLVYPIPFLDPDSARVTLAPDPEQPLERSHEAVLAEAMNRVRADLAARSPAGAGVRSVVMSHAFVVGAAANALVSDSERDIRVGGTDSVASRVFGGVDYVALGHLHGCQEPSSPDRTTRLRYSGSPLRYSFSETGQDKCLTLVDLGAGGVEAVTEVPVPQPRGMSRLQGPIDQLLDPSRFADAEGSWVQVTVTDDALPERMAPRVRERFPHALVVQHQPQQGPLLRQASPGRGTTTADPVAVAARFVHEVTGADPTDAELDAFRDAYELVRADGGDHR